jgi:hypothetical protein
MAESPEALQREIARNRKRLTSADAAQRREAALFLGEAADADSLDDLIDLYENDDDASVREAAGYALGMFRAVEEALREGGRARSRAIKLLERVEQGKLGKPGGGGGAGRWALAFLFTLITLIVLYVLLPPGLLREVREVVADALTPSPTPLVTPSAVPPVIIPDSPERRFLAREIRGTYNRLRDDSSNLLAQFQSVLGGGALDCTAYFNNTAPFSLADAAASANPDIAALVNRLNAALADYNTAFQNYDSACFGTAPLNAGNIGVVLAPLVQVTTTILPDIDRQLTNLETGQPIDAQPADPASAVTNTPEPPTLTPVPTTVIQVADPRSHLPRLYGIIDEMTGQRGAASLLTQYWIDVRSGGQTAGCTQTDPVIPANYVLPEVDAAASQVLANAVTLINQGLDAVRTGWDTFRQACRSGTLTGNADGQYAIMQTALAAFQAGLNLLDQVRDAV